MNKKLLIPAILATGLITSYLLATPALALVGQDMMRNSKMSNITSSVNVGNATHNFIKENQKVSFSAASASAEQQVTNGKVLGGHIGIVQGYLVYTFFVVNAENQTGYKVIVDPGNGQVLYTSQGNPLGMLDHGGLAMFGHGEAPWMRHGFNGFGGSSAGAGFNHSMGGQ